MSERLRVLVLSRSYPSDLLPTLGLWVEAPTRLLAKRHDVKVVSPVPWCPPLPNRGPARQYVRFRHIPRSEHRGGVDIVRPRFVVGPGTTLYPFEARAYYHGVRGAVEKLHRSAPFDLVHAHFVYPDGVVAHRLAARLGIPFVITEHAPWTGWLDRPGIARQALPAAHDASLLMPVSTSVERTIRSFLGADVPTRTIPVGVDGDIFRIPASRERREGQVLFVGFLNYTKGVDVLLHAFRRLVDAGADLRLVLVGGAHYRNTRRQEQELRDLAATLQLGDRIAFLGRRPPEEVAGLMAESAVVVLPSRAESFGAVLVEALACGTPVVATRCGGPEDIVTGEVGILVEPEDPTALADGIAHVLDHPDRYEPSALRAHAVRSFGLDSVTERISSLYEDAAGHRR